MNTNGRYLTDVDDADIHPEAFARKVSDVAHVVANIPDGDKPMEDGSPNAHPADELRVDGDIMPLNNVVNGIVEQGDQPSYPDDRQRLGTESTENYGSECAREQRFVDAEEATSAAVHVEEVGDGGQQTGLM